MYAYICVGLISLCVGLGVRESATVDRIKECHRRILLNNHPDRGGSAYLATKVNEAKDLLMKTKSGNN